MNEVFHVLDHFCSVYVLPFTYLITGPDVVKNHIPSKSDRMFNVTMIMIKCSSKPVASLYKS